MAGKTWQQAGAGSWPVTFQSDRGNKRRRTGSGVGLPPSKPTSRAVLLPHPEGAIRPKQEGSQRRGMEGEEEK